MRAIGVDVGSRALHAVALDGSCAVADARVFTAAELGDLVAWARDVSVAAVDAPDARSRGAHASDAKVAAKFREGRCAEVALGLRRGYWVPWVTPALPVPGSWIDVGIRAHAALRAAGLQTIEVFPNAGFRVLAGGERLPKKTTVEGTRTRAGLLRRAGVDAGALEAWSHDALDAALAAVVALQCALERADPIRCDDETCGRDGSVIWLPAAP